MLKDLQFAWRAVRRQPGFSALAVLTLGIGIGVNTVAFSAIDALFRKPYSFPDAGSLGRIGTIGTSDPYNRTSLPDYQDMARENRTFEAVFAEARLPLSMREVNGSAASDGATAEQAWGLLVSVNYLPALRVTPIVGRLFTTEDLSGPELPALVTERFWIDRFGGGTSVSGRTVVLNGRTFSIVGVIPDSFQGPGGLYEPQFWLPLERVDALNLLPKHEERQETWLTVLGRMKPGVTPPQALADLKGIMTQLAHAYPATNASRTVTYTPFSEGVAEFRILAQISWIGLGLVAIVLLIACFNVAALLLARASERQREIAVRTALGASRGRILRQLVTESTILAMLSGAVSLVLASWSADLLSAFSLPSPIPQRIHFSVDRRLVLFTIGLVTLAGVLPAIVPALQATRADLVGSLRRESLFGGRPSRVRNGFVIAQIAGATLFLAAALLFVRGFWSTTRFDPGFDVDHTLALELNPSTYGYDVPRAQHLFSELVERISRVPGVQHVALADRVPFSVGFPRFLDVSIAGEDCNVTRCRTAVEYGVSDGYFTAQGVALRTGRDLTEPEYRTDAPVAVIDETMAAALWPGTDAVGRWFRAGKNGRLTQVVGVAARVAQFSLRNDGRWYLYRPLRQSEFSDRVTIAIFTQGDPRLFIGAVQQQVHALDPGLPVTTVKTTKQRMELPLWPARTAARFFVICGSLALVLATVGLFGVTYYTVSRRTREFGVRVALGATTRNVVSLVVREGLTLSLAGVLIGSVGALVAMRLVPQGIFDITPSDPATYAMTASVQILVAIAACALPAYRASKADAMLALRQD